MSVEEALAAVVRDDWGRLASTLLSQFRRLDLVDDALGDAVEAAARSWPADGVPTNPAGWVFTAARRRILDRLRAEAVAARRMPQLIVEAERRRTTVRADPGGLIEDDLLRLVLMCSHPALDAAAASALSLRLVLGVSTADVARLFLVGEATMAARITRAKKKIVAAGIPFTIPGAGVLPDRLGIVAQTAYLAFTAGYAPGSGPDVVRVALAGEAIRLVRVVLRLRPDEPVLLALLALMLLQHSRRDARVDTAGRIVLLPDQDRRRWHRDEIDEARLVLAAPALRQPLTVTAAGYLIQAPDRRGARGGDRLRPHRLVAGGPALRHAAADRPIPECPAGPGGCAGRGGRTGRRPGRVGRPGRGVGGQPPVGRRAGRTAGPAGRERGGPRGLRPGYRALRQ